VYTLTCKLAHHCCSSAAPSVAWRLGLIERSWRRCRHWLRGVRVLRACAAEHIRAKPAEASANVSHSRNLPRGAQRPHAQNACQHKLSRVYHSHTNEPIGADLCTFAAHSAATSLHSAEPVRALLTATHGSPSAARTRRKAPSASAASAASAADALAARLHGAELPCAAAGSQSRAVDAKRHPPAWPNQRRLRNARGPQRG
jgi:hypothetical protein